MEQDKDQRPISFPQWAEALPRLLLSPMRQQQYRFSIIQYLRFCKQTGQRATVTSARTFIHDIPDHRHLGVSQLAVWKEALNWFFKAGRTADSSQNLVSSSQKNRWNSGARWQPIRPNRVKGYASRGFRLRRGSP